MAYLHLLLTVIFAIDNFAFFPSHLVFLAFHLFFNLVIKFVV